MSYIYNCKDCGEITTLLRQYHYGYNSWDSLDIVLDTTYYDLYTSLDQALRGELYFYSKYKLTAHLININQNIDSSYIAKVMYSYSDNEKTDYFMMYNFYIKKNTSGLLKLVPYIEYSKRFYTKHIAHNIEFYQPVDKKLSVKNLIKLNNHNDSVANFFEVNKEDIIFYFTKSLKEAYQIVGFDCFYKMNLNDIDANKYAFVDPINCIVFSPNLTVFKHELVHIYTQKKFPYKWNYWVFEGLATFIAGSLTQSLDVDLKKVSEHMKMNRNINFENIFDYKGQQVDVETSYMYTFFGLLCKLVYEKEGKKGLFDFISSGTKQEDVYKAIKKHLGYDKADVNRKLRLKILEY